MERFLGRYSPYFYAILRIVAGLIFVMRGSQKLFGFPPSGKPPVPLGAMMGTAGIIEFVGGLMIIFGLLASVAAFIASGEMAAAFFTVHIKQGFLPIQNGGELAVLFCFLFLYIAARGSGVWSIDSLVRRTPPAADARGNALSAEP